MRIPARLAPLAAFLLPLIVYGIGLRYLGSGDSAPAELLPISLLTQGTFDLDEFISGPTPPYWAQSRRGHFVSSYPVLPGLVNVPVYAVARLTGRDLFSRRFRLSMYTAMLVASLSVLFVYLTLERLTASRRTALGFALLYGFATELWSVASRALFQHGPALLFLSAGLYLLVRGGPAATAVSGLALALGVAARPTNVALFLPLAAYVGIRDRRRLPSFVGFATIPMVLQALYSWRYWGSPLSLAQPVAAANFAGNPFQGLAGLLVSPSRGLFVFTPVFLFAIPAASAAFRRTLDPRTLLERCLAVGALGILLVHSFWTMWWGGHSFGYRLILELALPLTVLIACDWPRIRARRTVRWLFGAAVAVSVLVQTLGAFVYPSRFNLRVDQEPGTLWDARNSELVLSTEKLLRALGWPVTLGSDTAVGPAAVTRPPRPRWWTAVDDDPSIPCALDLPQPDTIVRGPLTVLGWAKPSEGDAGEVWVALQHGGPGRRAERFARADVAAAMPRQGSMERAGFVARFDPPAHLQEVTVLVEVRSAQGRVRRLGPRTLLWGPERPLR
jgi:hypothetical protein